jgi:hypothetical protein
MTGENRSPSKLARLRALTWPERLILLESMLLLPLAWAGLRVLGLSRLHSWATRSPIRAGASRSDVELASIGALINVAGNHVPFPSTCLTRSLLLIWLLGRRGVRSELRIGVRMIEGGIDSHAWVEHEGKPINDTPGLSERFTVFDEPLSRTSGSPP